MEKEAILKVAPKKHKTQPKRAGGNLTLLCNDVCHQCCTIQYKPCTLMDSN